MNTRPMNEIFSSNLRNQLYLKRWSQADLAKKLDISEASVSKWCLGTSVPRARRIDQICLLLGCTVEDLTVDHAKTVEYAPEDIMAEQLQERPRLMRLMMYAMKLSDGELDDLIEELKK